MNLVAIRLLSQQLVSPKLSSPKDVVAHMGAIQAQDYRMMRWAVMMRMKKPSAVAFKQAYDNGDIIRLHLLRGTWQLVSADDYHWMLNLYADKAERVIRGWMKSNKVTIDDNELYAIREILVKTCEKKESVDNCCRTTKEDFSKALAEHGITMDAHRLSYHLRLAELGGILCSGNLTQMQATYALAAKKIGRADFMERDEMLMRLARKYFQSHSPATFEDYVWWSGLTATECRKGIDILGTELHKETYKNNEFYIHISCRIRGFHKGVSHLMAPFDEYLIGYKSRELVLASEYVHHAHTNNGIFFPIIAHDGIICGNWTPWKKNLKTSFFLPQKENIVFDRQWKAFCKLKEMKY